MDFDKIGLGVMASGGGSNFQALAEAVQQGKIPQAEIRLLIVNRPAAGALERAKRLGVESMVLEPKDFSDRSGYYARVAEEFGKRRVQLVCLAGFLLKLEPEILRKFPGRILNIHPALLPKFGGKGMYGHHVHEAVLKAGEKESGCTVHLVDDEYDHGPALFQARVPVLPGDTAESLGARVLEQEHRVYPEAVRSMVLKLRGAWKPTGE
jgi:phosphoribosylglycinamide formyltransferase-1